MSELTCTKRSSERSEIVFNANNHDWIMKLTDEGIRFNRERYPNSTVDDFALAVIEILEKQYAVKFERKTPRFERVISA